MHPYFSQTRIFMWHMHSPFYSNSCASNYLEYLTHHHLFVHQKLTRWSDLENASSAFFTDLQQRDAQKLLSNPHHVCADTVSLQHIVQLRHLYQYFEQDPKLMRLCKSVTSAVLFESFTRSFGQLQKHIPEHLLPFVAIDLLRGRMQLLIEPLKAAHSDATGAYDRLIPDSSYKKPPTPQALEAFYARRSDPKDPCFISTQPLLQVAYPHFEPKAKFTTERYSRLAFAHTLHHGIQIVRKCANVGARAPAFFHAGIVSYAGYSNSADILQVCLQAGMQLQHPQLFNHYNHMGLRHPLLYALSGTPHHDQLSGHISFLRFLDVYGTHQPGFLTELIHPNYGAAQAHPATSLASQILASKPSATTSYFLGKTLMQSPPQYQAESQNALQQLYEYLEHNAAGSALHAFFQHHHLQQHTPEPVQPTSAPKMRL